MTDQQAIFLLEGKDLRPLRETAYESEDLLQRALEEFPSLIAGVATAGESGRLMLVRREAPVPGSSRTGHLSLDHLFVDGRGVPVLVEVKRSSDTRARREVVAQMLDYAANGVAHWPIDRLRGYVTAAAEKESLDESALLQRELSFEDDPEAFWRSVDDNLRVGRVRLIFLADRLTSELVRIIEFLNEQMRFTEVLGIELPRYTGSGDAVVFVPRVIGQTSEAIIVKGEGSMPGRWTKDTLLAAAQEQCTPDERHFLEQLLSHREACGGRFSWGNAASAGVTGWYIVDGKETPLWNVNLGPKAGRGRFYFIFGQFVTRQGLQRVEDYGGAVAKALPSLADDVGKARQGGWKGWLGLPLAQAAENTQAVLDILNSAASAPPEEPGSSAVPVG